MKTYNKSTLLQWKKEDLAEYILCLQHNLECAEQGSEHLYKTVTAVMHENHSFSEAVSKVLDVWNRSGGEHYTKKKDKIPAEHIEQGKEAPNEASKRIKVLEIALRYAAADLWSEHSCNIRPRIGPFCDNIIKMWVRRAEQALAEEEEQ